MIEPQDQMEQWGVLDVSLVCNVKRGDGRQVDVLGVSGHGTGIPIFGQGGGISVWSELRKSLTKWGFGRTLLGKEVAP